jgi:hypothetical protein
MQVKTLGKNQTEIAFDNGDRVLVSYDQPVAAFVHGVLFETTTHWSVTTTRHIASWIGRFGTALAGDVSSRPQVWFDALLKGASLSMPGQVPETVIADDNNANTNTLAALV